jgi:hypothetical protein
MHKIWIGILLFVFSGTLAVSAPGQDRDDHRDRGDRHDNGKHKGEDRHNDDRHDRGDHRDNGKHRGWDNDRNRHANWEYDRDRIRPGRSYPYGRYDHVRADFIARRIDYRTRRVVLYDNSNWVVASYDLDRCRDWQWERDRVYVYDDDHHPGWYLLFNARLGRYVHVEYFGVH